MSACDISGSVRIQEGVAACADCGSTSRVGRGFCLNCMLRRALGCETETTETLEEVLDDIDVRDADWRIGNYQILEEIGRGGMGVIYRARQRHSRRIVALKRILSYQAESQETLVRFRREAEAVASLDHPNILPIFEVSESDDGLPFFSMKFAAGGSLLDAARSLRNNPRRIITLMAKVTRAVQHAHMQGILHRDLKPGNILLDGRGEPMVSDFGLAKWLDTSSDLTRTLTIFGTPGYIAPEQGQGPAKNLSPAADIYSIGAVLFDLFTGRTPFLGEHALAVIKQAGEKPAPKLRTLAPLADRDLETICAKCLEREPQARYRSAGDLAEDLERWLEGRPIIARPVSPPVRIWRWSKRNRKLAGSIAACLVLGVAASIWLTQSRYLSATVRQGQLAARSIAVLPFLDLDSTVPDEALANTVGQSVHNGLLPFGPSRVIPVSRKEPWLAGTGSADDIKEANGIVKARAVLTGTKRVLNGKIRLSIRLMNAATGDILLMQVFELEPNSSAMSEIASRLGPAIQSILDAHDWSTISPMARDPGMQNQAAREFIISGRQLMFRGNLADFDASIRCLEKAIQIEPNSAIAHAYLSATLGSRAHFVPDPNVLQQAEAEVREAVRLQPNLPDVHRVMAGVFLQKNEFPNALEEQLQAVEAGGPEERVAENIGSTLTTLGRPGHALNWLEMAKHWTLAPGSQDARVGDCWRLLSDDDKAEAAYRRAIELRPEEPDGWVGLCYLRLVQSDISGARKICEENQARSKTYEGTFYDNPPAELRARIELFAHNYRVAEQLYSELTKANPKGVAVYGGMSYASALGRVRQAIGDDSGGRSILKNCLAHELSQAPTSKNPTALYRVAAIEASLGDVDLAIQYLRAAVAAGWIDWRSLKLDPRFDAIAADPRVQEIISGLRTKVSGLRRQSGQPFTMARNGEPNSP
jgi:serine/threonine protein kinase/Tfp pilus assembly protein PilF